MAGFDNHAFCAHCREKVKGKDPCVELPESAICEFYELLTPQQRLQLSTPSYKLKKEKREARKIDSTPSKESDTLVDAASVSVIGVVDNQGTVQSPSVAPLEKKTKKEKAASSKSSKPKKPDTDSKIADLDSKWSERFNPLEALLLARSIEPTFSSNVKVTPTHSPPAGISQGSDPFIRPVEQTTSSVQFPALAPLLHCIS